MYRAAGEDPKKIDHHTKEVPRYREALWSGFEQIKRHPLSTNLFIDLVRIIKLTDLGIRKVPGTKIANSLGEVVYTPPEGEGVIRDLLSNLERFAHAEDGLDPLVKLAVFHYQFEAIHPFYRWQWQNRSYPQYPLSGGKRASRYPGALSESFHYPQQERLLYEIARRDREKRLGGVDTL